VTGLGPAQTALCDHFDEHVPAKWRCQLRRCCPFAHGRSELRSKQEALDESRRFATSMAAGKLPPDLTAARRDFHVIARSASSDSLGLGLSARRSGTSPPLSPELTAVGPATSPPRTSAGGRTSLPPQVVNVLLGSKDRAPGKSTSPPTVGRLPHTPPKKAPPPPLHSSAFPLGSVTSISPGLSRHFQAVHSQAQAQAQAQVLAQAQTALSGTTLEDVESPTLREVSAGSAWGGAERVA
jgi:hypothetical protein